MPAITTPWSVKHGPQVERLKNHLRLPLPATEQLIVETSAILGLCGNPDEPTSAETGLALGFVQSGKTMSFTSLIAMARDNDYQLVIVVAGVSKVLVEQSVSRLKKDLQFDDANSRAWRIIENPSLANGLEDVRTTLRDYRNPDLPRSLQRTAIIVVMKNKKRLESLTQVMERLGPELQGVPTLIVDDEADQAGMNTQARANRRRVLNGEAKKRSVVYAQLLGLKETLPHHTFVQYTATPQAPLFIERQDELSPSFIKLLTPGAGYTGGEQFFTSPLADKLVKVIPASEVYTADNPLAQPPSSLAEAMRIFFLGVAEHFITDSSEANRSMMVHPSQLTGFHQVYYTWVNRLKDTWESLLQKPEANLDRQRVVTAFQEAHAQLLAVNPSIAPFEEHLRMLPHAISSTQVRQLNAARGSAPQIDWINHYSFILVGGQAMDRGFTVEGLTVTYMPRGLGTGTADTIQQRARFFGYKEKYLHLCRVYLTRDVFDAFSDYVKHEIDLRYRLQPFDAGRMLNDFERCVQLPSSLTQLTRPAVLSDDLERYSFGGDWLSTRTVIGSEPEYHANEKLIQDFVAKHHRTWQADSGRSERTADQIHKVVEVSLADLIQLLRSYTYLSTDDASAFHMLASSLEAYSRANPHATGAAYQMSSGKARKRSATHGKVRQLFQGQNPKNGTGRDIIYPGDKKIMSVEKFTVQLHKLRAKNGAEPEKLTSALAVWVPAGAGIEMVKLANE